jgi:hypothetical protein
MRNQNRLVLIAMVLLLAMIVSGIVAAQSKVFTYIPNVPWSVERVNGSVGREFKIYCTKSFFGGEYAVLGFKHFV